MGGTCDVYKLLGENLYEGGSKWKEQICINLFHKYIHASNLIIW